MKHTPSPWQLRGLSDHVRVEHVTAAGKTNVARCGSSKVGPREPSNEEVWANAHLIAAAPELLEALKELEAEVADLRAGRTWDPNYEGVKKAHLHAKTAIRKAEGAA